MDDDNREERSPLRALANAPIKNNVDVIFKLQIGVDSLFWEEMN